jgi:hypothetical protein
LFIPGGAWSFFSTARTAPPLLAVSAPAAPAALAASANRLLPGLAFDRGQLGGVELVVIEIIQQHAEGCQNFVVFAVCHAVQEGEEALHAFSLYPVARAQAGFEQGNGTLHDHLLHFLVGGNGALLQVDLIPPGDPQ